MLTETFGWRAISYGVINIRIYASLEEESANVSILVCLDLSWVISISSTAQSSLDFPNSIAMAWHLLLLISRWSCNVKYLKLLYKVRDKPRHFFIHFSKLFIYWYFKMINKNTPAMHIILTKNNSDFFEVFAEKWGQQQEKHASKTNIFLRIYYHNEKYTSKFEIHSNL